MGVDVRPPDTFEDLFDTHWVKLFLSRLKDIVSGSMVVDQFEILS